MKVTLSSGKQEIVPIQQFKADKSGLFDIFMLGLIEDVRKSCPADIEQQQDKDGTSVIAETDCVKRSPTSVML